MKTRQELEAIAKDIRLDIVKMTYNSGTKGAHLGGSMSMAEILAVLYGTIMKYDVGNPLWEFRDRFILSKAHAAVGLYAALKYAGFLSESEIDGAMRDRDFRWEWEWLLGCIKEVMKNPECLYVWEMENVMRGLYGRQL